MIKPDIVKKTRMVHYHYLIRCPTCKDVFGTGDKDMIYCSKKCVEVKEEAP